MKKIFLILLVFVAFSCTKDFGDMNTDVKNPTAVPYETLFSNAQRNLADQIASISVNLNVYNMFAQYITETTYTDEANYDVVNRTIPDNDWMILYRDVLRDFKEATLLIEEEEVVSILQPIKDNKLAIIEIMNVYTYHRMVDIWGNIPYSEALDIEKTTPKYDDAVTIYKDLFSRLDAAISKLDAGAESFGTADLIYGGDVSMWIKFANSLKLKMAISVIDAPELSTQSSAAITSSVAAGVFTSNSDNAAVEYLSASPNTSPIYQDLVASGRHDFVGANTTVDYMKDLNDPRLPLWFQTRDTGNGDEYIGGIYGANNAYDNYSPLSLTFEEPTLESVFLDYTEVQFYLAEAVQKGKLAGSVETYYNNGIESSIIYWGGTAADVTAYLANADVAFSTAQGTDLQKIAMQSWLASFNRGFNGWTTWRRLDYPTFNPPPGVDASNIPVRMIYPINEQTLNNANYSAAAQAIGQDKLTQKLFWDKN